MKINITDHVSAIYTVSDLSGAHPISKHICLPKPLLNSQIDAAPQWRTIQLKPYESLQK